MKREGERGLDLKESGHAWRSCCVSTTRFLLQFRYAWFGETCNSVLGMLEVSTRNVVREAMKRLRETFHMVLPLLCFIVGIVVIKGGEGRSQLSPC